jgi:hypothetical protein
MATASKNREFQIGQLEEESNELIAMTTRKGNKTLIAANVFSYLSSPITQIWYRNIRK